MALCCDVLGNWCKNQTNNPINLCLVSQCRVHSKFWLKTDSVTVVYRVCVLVTEA